MERMFYQAYAFNADIWRWTPAGHEHAVFSCDRNEIKVPQLRLPTAAPSPGVRLICHGYASSSGSHHGPPAAWVDAKDDACDASTHPTTAASATAPTLVPRIERRWWTSAPPSLLTRNSRDRAEGRDHLRARQADGVGVFDPETALWTSAPPSLLINSVEPRRKAAVDHLRALRCGRRGGCSTRAR